MQVELVPGGYGSDAYSCHLALTGLSEQLRDLGFRLQRYERGPRGRDRPVINLNVRRPPHDVARLDAPVRLHLAPYSSQVALNVYVELRGLRDHVDAEFGLPLGQELGVRAFIPNYDGEYIAAEDADPSPGPTPSADQRPRDLVMRAIRARRGAKSFRDGQLDRFASRCAISGCGVVDVLEAAHIRPYRTEADNLGPNGVLLRSDLHTLFDLDLIAIRPDELTIALHPSIQRPPYDPFHNQPVELPNDGFDAGALLQRWAAFRAKGGRARDHDARRSGRRPRADDPRPGVQPAAALIDPHASDAGKGGRQTAAKRSLRVRSPTDLPVRELLPALQETEATLSRRHGPFDVFGLFRRRRGLTWDVVIAAPWAESERRTIVERVAEDVQRAGGTSAVAAISRILVNSDPRFVATVHALVQVEHGLEVVGPGDYGIIEIARGYVITSRPPTPATRVI